MIVPIGEGNKISGTHHIFNKGQTISANSNLSNRFDFNELGIGKNAFHSNKYLAVEFKINNCTHFGWIKFSSKADGGKNSNTPIYYHKITLSIHETGYNQAYNQPIIIE